MSVQIIFEDEYIVVANKPNNVLVHHAHHSRNKADELSLLQLLEEQTGMKLYPVHRLDRKTSGILLLTKKTEYVSKFQDLFGNDQIQKIYYGIVRGFAPAARVIDSPVKGRDADVYKEAETHLKQLATVTLDIPVKPYDSSRYSLVELSPKTGRLHQLRIHMNKISHPLINDAKYGDKNHDLMYEREFGWTNLFLHAGSLSFQHPFTEETLHLKADFSNDWVEAFNRFEWENPLVD